MFSPASYNPSFVTITGRGTTQAIRTYNTIFKIISLIKRSQSQVPGIVVDTVYLSAGWTKAGGQGKQER